MSDFELPDESIQKYTVGEKAGNTWVARLHYNLNMLNVELKDIGTETLKVEGAQVTSILEFSPN